MTYYATDADIGADCFNGLTVPGTNTVNTTKNDSLKIRAQAFTNLCIGKVKDAEETDTYGLLKEVFLIAYRAFLSAEQPKLSKQIITALQLRHQSPAIQVWESYQDVHGENFGSGRWG